MHSQNEIVNSVFFVTDAGNLLTALLLYRHKVTALRDAENGMNHGALMDTSSVAHRYELFFVDHDRWYDGFGDRIGV
jgi:hypothetical protein